MPGILHHVPAPQLGSVLQGLPWHSCSLIAVHATQQGAACSLQAFRTLEVVIAQEQCADSGPCGCAM
jgi:hypothetical protein